MAMAALAVLVEAALSPTPQSLPLHAATSAMPPKLTPTLWPLLLQAATSFVSYRSACAAVKVATLQLARVSLVLYRAHGTERCVETSTPGPPSSRMVALPA